MTKIRGTWPERRNNVVSRIYSNAFIGMKKNYFDVSKIELFILRIIRKKYYYNIVHVFFNLANEILGNRSTFPHNSD